MKETLINNGWINYRTGCSCVGLPRYWKNDDRMGWEIVTKGSRFSVRKDNDIVDSGIEGSFNEIMKKHGLIK